MANKDYYYYYRVAHIENVTNFCVKQNNSW